MKRILKDYFSFSKKERTAVIILLLLASVFTALPYLIPRKQEVPVIDPASAAFIKSNQSSERRNNLIGNRNDEGAALPGPGILFPFDPNTLPVDGWIRLGVKPKTAATIINYRNKGGKFRSAEDIRKIWGLSKTLADQLVPYVSMETLPTSSFYKKGFHQKDQPLHRFSKTPSVIDINTATPDEWKALPGIGDVLANRIVNYRDRVGGFSGVLQVKKVYGISDSVFAVMLPFLRADATNLPKLDLNTINPYLLAERTGISADVAKGIIVYRQQYGRFKTVEDLRMIIFINDSLYRLIHPHVIVKPG